MLISTQIEVEAELGNTKTKYSTLYILGTLVPAFIHSPLLPQPGLVSHKMMHITDWLPTLITAAGVTSQQFIYDRDTMDGMDVWKAVVNDEDSPRSEVVYNIDDVGDGGKPIAALRQGDWKLVQRPSGNDDWIEEPVEMMDPEDDSKDPRPAPPAPVPTNHTFLFNIADDPEEREDLSEVFPDKVVEMVDRITELSKELVKADNPDTVFAGNPINHGWEWSTGWCNISSRYHRP